MRKPTKTEAIIPIVAMLVLLGVGYGYYKLPIQVLLLVAAFIAFLVGKRVGLDWDTMMSGITEKVSSSMISIFVMICVGALIGTWIVSGVIPMMIYYGIKLINPRFLLVTAFIVTAIISVFTGTSFGSAGTAGVAIMGIAYAQGVPLPYAAGAVISGAVFGDKLSPFSDTTILAPIAAGCNLYDHIKHMMYTTGAATILSLIVFTIIGFNTPHSLLSDNEKVTLMLTGLSSIFKFSWLLIIPPIIVFVGAYTKKPIIPMLLLSSVVAVLLAIFVQGFSINTALDALVKGFSVDMLQTRGVDTSSIVPEIATLLNRGGMVGMMSTVLLILCAFSFAGIVSKVGCMEVILSMIVSKVKSVGKLILSTVIATILMSIFTGSSYLAILIPGEMFKDLYKKWGLHAKNLSRTLEDSGTCVVPLVPWSIAGIYMSTTLGVPTLEYLPFAVLCYSSFVFAIIFGFTGFSIAKIKNKD
ncbi:Na+/H+ antiporter NhaC [Romboutsia sp. 1001713B170207_170306_H8]|uniref:Na+/H+ antiporter NhaC n=1 Tax=Romboutsia sp. 1001713B170207_170306_H8 TaxID=2787112 RepID=UPI00189A2D2A|nr:Na+/H+ antiporter NhaC [Romboutsia sp. 1001713B170207_170306_H8]